MTCLKWIAAGIVSLALSITLALMLPNSPKTLTEPPRASSPTLKARDCLALTDAEKWQPRVFAEVLQVGERNYLLDFSPYKRRSKFADIAAYTLPFEFVEEATYKVACPERR